MKFEEALPLLRQQHKFIHPSLGEDEHIQLVNDPIRPYLGLFKRKMVIDTADISSCVLDDNWEDLDQILSEQSEEEE